MIAVYASHRVKSENAEEFTALARSMIAETRKEKGVISYELVRGIEDPELLSMMERWEDMDSLRAHMQTEHFKEYVPKMGALSYDGGITVHEIIV